LALRGELGNGAPIDYAARALSPGRLVVSAAALMLVPVAKPILELNRVQARNARRFDGIAISIDQ
jgi:hypothetical protein